MRYLVRTFLCVFLFILSSCGKLIHDEKVRVFTIGSGSSSAMYFPVASALCNVFNKHNVNKQILCKAKLSKGAEYNLHAIQKGEFDMGISQANLQYDAYMGYNKFGGLAHKKIRTLFNVHDEYLTIIAKKDSGIRSFSDLKGKRINSGNPGSGSKIFFAQMVSTLGWTMDDFDALYEESGSDIKKVLCHNNKADAAVYIVGHPNQSFRHMLDHCNTHLVSLSPQEINKFISLSPKNFYKTKINRLTYENNPAKVSTFASKTILSASSDLDPEIVRTFVQVIFDNKEELISNQSSLSVIGSDLDINFLAPIHKGMK